jgi:hypothetical protein
MRRILPGGAAQSSPSLLRRRIYGGVDHSHGRTDGADAARGGGVGGIA